MPSKQTSKATKAQQGKQMGPVAPGTVKNARDIQTPDRTPVPDAKGKGNNRNVHFSKDQLSNEPTTEVSSSQPVAESSTPMDTDGSVGEEFNQSDEDSSAESTEDGPRPEPEELVLQPWVKRVIRRETENLPDGFLDELFNWPFEGKYKDKPEPTGEEITAFFERLNQYIRAENQNHPGTDIEDGVIPHKAFIPIVQGYAKAFGDALAQNDQDAAWKASNATYITLKEFNKRHFLPQSWNLSPVKAFNRISTENPNPELMVPYPDEILVEESVPSIVQPEESDETLLQRPVEDLDIENETLPSRPIDDLDAIDTLAIEKRGLQSGEVLYWWTVGAGSQTFIRYGEKPYQIYRIRAGSHQVYDRTTTEQVLSIRRGNTKRIIPENGIKKEVWKWGREHVKRIVGVGFKIAEDEEHGGKSKITMNPSYAQGSYPQTRLLVEWKDGNMTLEERSFGCRILQTKNEGIYSFLSVMEDAYWERHGLVRSECEDQSDMASEDESDSDSESGSSYTDTELPARPKSKGTYKLRSRSKSTAHRDSPRAKKIQALERELESLRLSEKRERGSSISRRSQTPRNARHDSRRR